MDVHLPSIKQSIHVSRTRHAGYYWGSKDVLVIDIFVDTYALGSSLHLLSTVTCSYLRYEGENVNISPYIIALYLRYCLEVRNVMVRVVGNGLVDPSSNPG